MKFTDVLNWLLGYSVVGVYRLAKRLFSLEGDILLVAGSGCVCLRSSMPSALRPRYDAKSRNRQACHHQQPAPSSGFIISSWAMWARTEHLSPWEGKGLRCATFCLFILCYCALYSLLCMLCIMPCNVVLGWLLSGVLRDVNHQDCHLKTHSSIPQIQQELCSALSCGFRWSS